MAYGDKRRYPRIDLPKGMQVAWQGGGLHEVSRVSTLALGGLFISTPNPPAVGTVLKLLFLVPTGEVRALATARDVKPGEGMGIQFTDMGAEDRARLNRLLKRLLR